MKRGKEFYVDRTEYTTLLICNSCNERFLDSNCIRAYRLLAQHLKREHNLLLAAAAARKNAMRAAERLKKMEKD